MTANRHNLAKQPDFQLGDLKVSPSTCRIFAAEGEIRVEPQTMAVLVVLLRAAGATVTREELVHACWQGRIVSDDTISRTIAKVRSLARGATPAPFTVETLPKVGYRLVEIRKTVTGVNAEKDPEPSGPPANETTPPPQRPSLPVRWELRVAALMAMTVAAILLVWGGLPAEGKFANTEPGSGWDGGDNLRAWQVADALFTLDEKRLSLYLQKGWNPNWLLDSEGSTSLHTLMLVCERNPSHDQAGVVNVARFLMAAGSDPSIKNKWDDSPLDIAIAPRYCGPHHPLTEYLKTIAPAEEIRRVMARACSEAFGGVKSKSDWAKSDMTRAECASVGVSG